jgi:hypothetical protein
MNGKDEKPLTERDKISPEEFGLDQFQVDSIIETVINGINSHYNNPPPDRKGHCHSVNRYRKHVRWASRWAKEQLSRYRKLTKGDV